MYPALANSKINKLHDFICYVLHPSDRCTLNSVQMDRFLVTPYTPRFIFGLSPFHWTLKSFSSPVVRELFLRHTKTRQCHVNCTVYDCFTTPYTKLASLRDVGVNAGFVDRLNRLNFRILVKGEKRPLGTKIFAPRQTLDSLSPYSVCNW